MSLVVTGRVSRVTEREAGTPGNSWTERTIVIEDWGTTSYVVAGRELTEQGVPAEGEQVALVVAVRPYATKTGALSYGLTGLRRHSELSEATGKGVRAAS